MPLRSGCLQKALGLAVCLALWGSLGQAQAQGLAPVAADALPTGGQVVSGAGRISQNGAAMVIEQQSQKMITNWQQFNVGKDASVTFQQPNSAAVSLNRVRSMDPSQIHGRIQANGKVFLINPNGVVFGSNAVVDAGGLLASTRDIADQDFLDGVMRFSGDSAGKVDQQGQIRTPDGGFVVLIGQQVRQSGTVSGGKGAHLGLVSANRVQVNVAGNELVGYRVEQGAVSALVENTGTISADGGTIVLSAHAFDALTTSVVNQAGVVKANGLSGDGGRVVLQGDRVTLASGSITTATGVKNGGSVDIISDHVDIQGVVDVSGQAQGGRAWVWAEQTARLNQASVRAESSQGAAGQIDVQAPVIELENTNVSASGETNGGMITLLAQTEAPSTALVAHLESRPASQMGLLDPAHPLNNPTSPPSEPTRLAILGSSVLSSNGRRGAGGGLVLTGDEISLLDTSQLISTGATGGGFVLVGGDWQGGANEQRRVFDAADAVYEATKVTIAQGVLIDASATDHGDGGTVVLWSDITNANSVTAAHGSIYAKGGAQSGNGGQIETSGAHLDTNGISVNAGTLSGNSGLWLIDPYDYIINSTAASNIVTALNNNTSVTVTTSTNNTDYGSNGNSGSSGNITVSSSITAASGSGGLTLRAANDIVLSGTIDIGGDIQIIANREITSSDHITIATRGGDILFSADADASGGGPIGFYGNLTVRSNGGDITFAGGDISGSGYAVGYGTTKEEGIDFRGTTMIESQGGDITFRGKSDTGAASGQGIMGVAFWGDTTNKIVDSGVGKIYMEGISYGTDTTNDYPFGITLEGATVTLQSANTTSDAIVLKGTNYSGGPSGQQGIDGRGIDMRATNTRLYATGEGGGILLEASGYYGFTLYNNVEILAKSGPIKIINTFDGSATDLYLDGNFWFGSKAGTAVTASSSSILIRGNEFAFNGATPDVGTTGTFTLEPVDTSTSFDQAVNTNWFTWNQNGQTIGGLTYGKSGNASGVNLESLPSSIAGSMTVYGGDVQVISNINTSAGNGDIRLEGSTRVIASSASRQLISGSGNILLISNDFANSDRRLLITSAGTLTIQPYTAWTTTFLSGTGFNFKGSITSGNFVGDASFSESKWLTINSMANLRGFTLGRSDNLANSLNSISIDSPIEVAGSISLYSSSIAVNANLTANGGNILIDADYGNSLATNLDGIYVTEGVTIRTNTSGNITLVGRSGNNNTSNIMGVEVSNGTATNDTQIISAGTLSITGISDSASSSGTRGIALYRGTYSANGDINISGKGSSSNKSDVTLIGATVQSANGDINLIGLNVDGSFYTYTGGVGNSLIAKSDISLSFDKIYTSSGDIHFDTDGVVSMIAKPGSIGFRAPLTLGPDITFDGGISGLRVGDSTNTADLTFNGAVSINGPINIYGGTVTLNAALATTAPAGDISISASGLTGTGGISVASGRGLTVTQSGDSTYSGIISGASASFTKAGAGRLNLTNLNTYSGGTNVSAGTLGIYTNSAAGAGALTASDGATLLFGRAVTEFANDITLTGVVSIDLDTSVDYLIVGGGGGGGAHVGGGGGGGGVLSGSTELAGGSFDVSVGQGGLGAIRYAGGTNANHRDATSGGNSTFANLTAIGGGHGASWDWQDAGDGGSGGGGAFPSGTGGPGLGTVGQGNNGGQGIGSGDYGYVTGGGGGAGEPGGKYSTTSSGDGGDGLESSITGVLSYYGGGGGGGLHTNTASTVGLGGLGGGAPGSEATSTKAASGTANTGGGGGGSGFSNAYYSEGGNGGSGMVIVRYLGATAGTGGTVSSGSGSALGHTLHSFTTAGSAALALNPVAPVLSGNITGTGSLTVAATGGSVTLTGTNTYSGQTTISGGSLQLGSNTSTGAINNSDIVNNGTLVFDFSTDTTIASNISGSGSVTVKARYERFLDKGSSDSLSDSDFETIAENISVEELLYRISGGLVHGGANGSPIDGLDVGVNNKTFDAANNTGSLYIIYSNTFGQSRNYTKRLKVDLRQDGANVQARIDSAPAEYVEFPNVNDLNETSSRSFTGQMGYATSYAAGGYGLRGLDKSVKVSFSGAVAPGGGIALEAKTFTMSDVSAGGQVFEARKFVKAMAEITSDGSMTLNASGISVNSGLAGNAGYLLENNGTLTFNLTSDWVYPGVIFGSGDLVKSGTGTLTLSGTNTYTGTTTVNDGTLSLGAHDRLPDSTALTVNANGTFSLNGFNETVGSISGSGLIVNGAVVRDGLVMWLDAGNVASYAGTGTTWYDLSGNGYNATLYGNPTYNAGTSLFSFTNNSQYAQIATLPADFLGGTVSGLTVFTVTNFGSTDNWERIIDLGNTGVGGNNPNHNIILSRFYNDADRLNFEIYTDTNQANPHQTGDNTAIANNVKSSYAGTADGANFRVFKDGLLNTTTAQTTLPMPVERTSNYIGKSNWTADATFRGDIGTVMIYDRALSTAEIAHNHQLLFNRSEATLTVGGNNISATFSGKIENGVSTLNLVKAGSGTLTLTGEHNYSGSTTVQGGTLDVSGSGRLGTASLYAGAIANASVFRHSSSADQTFSGVISGAGELIKEGSSTLTLFGTNTYSGATTVSAGSLIVGGSGKLGNGTYAGAISNAGTFEYGSSATQTLSGVISGNGTVVKSGAGTLTLTATNTYTGDTTISAGSLIVGGSGKLGNGTYAGAISNAGTFEYGSSAAQTLSGVISGAGALVKSGAGTLTLSGANDYTGATTISGGTLIVSDNNGLGTSAGGVMVASGAVLDLNAVTVTGEALTLNGGTLKDATSEWTGNITLGANSIVDVGAGDTLTLSGVISDGAGTYGITKNGTGLLVLTGANTYNGTTTIGSGTIRLGNGTTAGSLDPSSNVSIASASTLQFNLPTSTTFANAISGAGSLSKLDTNNLTLTGAATYTGSTAVAGGTLTFQNNAAPTTSGFTGSGAIVIEPVTSFGSALTPSHSFANTLTGLTIGKEGNTADITLSSNLEIAGSINVYGGRVSTQALSAEGPITVVAIGSDVLINAAIQSTSNVATTLDVKARRHIRLGVNAPISSQNAALTTNLWADTNADGDGIVYVESDSINTHGGNLTFGKQGQSASIGGSTVLVGGDVFFQRLASGQNVATGGGHLTIYGETIVANTNGIRLDTTGNSDGAVALYGLLNSGNQYTFVNKTGSSGSGSWSSARTEAMGATAGGSAVGDSYLVNITSRLENSIAGLSANYGGAWIGAYRNISGAKTGDAWLWADGPEASVQFFTEADAGGGVGTSGFYNNFANGEPNGFNCPGTTCESVGQFFGSEGKWNDLSQVTRYSATQDNPYRVLGFVRETNLAGSPVTINAGGQSVVIEGGVGTSKALHSLSVTAAATTINGNGAISNGDQTYSGSLTFNDTSATQDVRLSAGGITGITVGGAMSVNGAIVNIDSNLISNATTGNGITIQAQRILQDNGIDATTAGADISYTAANFVSTTASEQVLSILGSLSDRATLNANGGNITLSGSYGAGGVAGSSERVIGFVSADLITHGSGNISLTADATNSGNTSNAAWGMQPNDARIITDAGDITLTMTGGAATSNSRGLALDGQSMQLLSSSGAITIRDVQPVGLTGAYTGLYLKPSAANTIVLGADGSTVVSSSSNILIEADKAAFVNQLTRFNTSGTVSIRPLGMSFESALDTTLLNVEGIVTELNIGKAGNTSNVTVGRIVSVAGPISVYGGDITLSAGISLTSGTGSNIVLSASDDFVNNAGSSALNVSGGGRWVVYAADTSGNTYGSLNSNNTAVYGDTYATLAPASVEAGNRYVFGVSASQAVTLTTIDANKVYGETIDLSSNYTLITSGIPGEADAYLGVGTAGGSIDLATVFSANPTITSTKLAATSSVGTASITASGGSVNSGYTVSFVDSGVLSVTQLPSATWVGGATGNWSDPANWAWTTDNSKTGALPSAGNVALAVIPSGSTVTADAALGYTGKVAIQGGTLKFASDAYLGAVPQNAVADLITLNGGTLRATSSFSMNANRGITLASGGGAIEVDAGNLFSVASVISGSGGFTKKGAGSLQLSGANTYSGTTTISAGTIRQGINNALPEATALVIEATGTFDMWGYSASVASLAGSGTITSSARRYTVNNDMVVNLDAGDPDSYAGTGTTWTNLANNGLNATLVNNPVFDRENGFIALNGTSQYISLGSGTQTEFNGSLPFTLSIWVEVDDLPTTNVGLITRWQDLNARSTYRYTLNANSKTSMTRNVSPWGVTGTGVVDTDVPVLLTATFNGTQLTNFVNGVLSETKTFSTTMAKGGNLATLIGTYYNSAGVLSNFLDAKVYSAQIYNSALTPQEIAANLAPVTLTVGSDNSSTSFSGDIRAATNPVNIVKTGTGALTLSGDVAHRGSTTINSGELIISNDAPSIQTSSIAGNGALRIVPTSTSFSAPFSSSNLTMGSLGELQIGAPGNTANITIGSDLTIAGPMTVHGGDLDLNSNIDTSASAASGTLLLKASGNITLASAKSVTTAGGNVTFWADADASNGGSISLQAGAALQTNGGDIVIAGGADDGTNGGVMADGIPDGYARGLGVSGIRTAGSFSINAGSGSVLMRGSSNDQDGVLLSASTTGLVSTTSGAIQLVGLVDASNITAGKSQSGIKTSGGGAITITSTTGVISLAGTGPRYGIGFGINDSTFASDNATATIVQSSNTSASAISITGTGGALGVSHGISFRGASTKVYSKGALGGLTVTGNSPSWSSTVYSDVELLSASGAIQWLNSDSSSGVYGANKPIAIGSKAGVTGLSTSSADVTLNFKRFEGVPAFAIGTTGQVSIQGVGGTASFSSSLTSGLFGLNANSHVMSGFTFGSPSNTASLSINQALAVSGAVTLYGGNIAVNGALTATDSDINIHASGAVTQTAAITASGLGLHGTGSFTLNNSGNSVGTLAGGSDITKLRSLSFTNAGALTIGTVNPTGITATGDVLIETLTGDLNLSANISTVSTSQTALRLNAGKSAAAATAAGGEILLGSGVDLTTGVGGRSIFYMGSRMGSSALTTLIPSGEGRARYGADETTNFAAAPWANLGVSGRYFVIREQPTLTVKASDQTIVYGQSAATSGSTVTAGLLDGDTAADAIQTEASIAVSGLANVNGLRNVGSHTLVASGATSKLGYAFAYETGTLTVTKKTVGLSATKVYDATNSLTDAVTVVTGVGSETLLYSGATVNAATVAGATHISAITLLDGTSGGLVSNYQLPALSAATTPATITRAPVVVTANNDSKFVTTADTSGYAGVSYAGFQGGETEAVLTTVPMVTRVITGVAANDERAGSHLGKLVAAGAAADNYSFSYVAGDYTIAPAGSLVVTASGASVYGEAATYSVLGAKYMNGNSALFTLAAPTRVGNTFTFNDGVGGETTLTLTPDSPVLSGSTNLATGRYDLAATGVSSTSNNYGAAIAVVGSHEVSQRDLTVTAAGLTKVYDGTTDMVNLSLSSNALAGDRISLSASSAYADKNADASKPYAVSNIATLGLDASNYNLLTQSITGSDGVITQRTLNVNYVGVNKVYDGFATATVATTDNRVSGDDFTIARTAHFQVGGSDSKTVGANKDVAVTAVSISGTDANNYALAATTGATTASITPKILTISGITASDKVYDAGTVATVSVGGVTSDVLVAGGLVSGDLVTVSVPVGTFSDKNVGDGKTVTLSSFNYGGTDLANYTVVDQTTTTANITPATLTLAGLTTGVTKVYDGRNTLPAGTTGYGSLTGILSSPASVLDSVSLVGVARFADDNAGTQAIVQNTVALDGVDAGNYVLDWTNGSGTITPAPLTITANNDAKFVTEADVAGYTGVSYSGFVNGETASGLISLSELVAPTVSRANVGTDETAGTYTLVPSGGSATNYAITYANGSYTIVPAGQLLIRVQDQSHTYGSPVNYVVESAKYLNDDNGNVINTIYSTLYGNEVGALSQSGALNANVSINDGSGGSAGFTLIPTTVVPSTSGNVKVGSYAIGASNVVDSSGNFSSTVTVVGTQTVTQRALTLTSDTVPSKTYDGDTSLAVNTLTLALPEKVTGDLLAVASSTRSYANRNAGVNKVYTLSGLALSGADVANYYLAAGSSQDFSNGEITAKAVSLSLATPTAPVTRTYSGSADFAANASELADLTAALVAGDSVGAATIRFNNKNVATGKTIVPLGAVISDGNNGNNYAVTYVGNTASTIERLAEVTWTGAANDNEWFNPDNWSGGAVPDLANVAIVNLPLAAQVNFNSDNLSGLAEAGIVNLDAIRGEVVGTSRVAGSLNQQVGDLNVSGNVSLGGWNQASGVSLTVGGDMQVSTTNTVNALGIHTINGALNVSAAGADITLSNASNDFGGSVSAMGHNVTLKDANAMDLGASTVSGALHVTIGGPLTDSGALTVMGATAINASGQAVTLNTAANDFQDVVTVTAGQTSLNDVGALEAELTTGVTTLTAGGDLTVSGTTADLTTITTGTGKTSFGVITVGGALDVTSAGALTDDGALTVSGATTINAVDQTVTLDTTANDFTGSVSIAAEDVTLVDATALDLGASTISGNLLLATGSGLTDSGALAVTGTTTINAAGQTVTLDTAASDFTGAVSVTAEDVSLLVADTLTFGASSITGDLLLTTLSGGVSQAAAIAVQGASTFAAKTGAAQLASLGNAANDFQGLVSFIEVNGGSWATVAVADRDDLSASLAVSGDASLSAARDLSVSGAAMNLTTITAGSGTTSFGAITVGGALDVTSAGAVSQTGALAVTGATTIETPSNVNLSSTANQFGGSVIVDANNVNLGAANGPLVVATNASGSGGIAGSLTVTLLDGDLSVDTNGSAIALGNIQVFDADASNDGRFEIVTDNANISQATGTSLTVSGAVNVNAGTADVNLSSTDNQFSGSVTVDANDVNLGAANGPLVVATNASGSGGIAGSLTVTLLDGDLSVDTNGSAIALGNIQVFDADASNDGRFEIVTDNANISQATGTSLTVFGDVDLNAGTAQVDLTNSGNFFQSDVAVVAASAAINSSAALSMSVINVTGDLFLGSDSTIAVGDATVIGGSLALNAEDDVTVGKADIQGGNLNLTSRSGDVTLGGPSSVTGAVNLTAANGAISVTDTANNFGGPLNLAAQSATIDLANSVQLGTVTVSLDLDLSVSAGGLTQTGAMTIGGTTSLAVANGVVLSNPNNAFGGAVDVAAQSVALVTSGALNLGALQVVDDAALTAGGNLIMGDTQVVNGSLTANSTAGSISQATGTALNVANDSSFNAAVAVTLDAVTNELGDFIRLVAPQAAIAAQSALRFDQISVPGLLDLTSTGQRNGEGINLGTAAIGTLNASATLGNLNLGTSSIAQDMNLLANGGAITQTGPLLVEGKTTMFASGAINLPGPGNKLKKGAKAKGSPRRVQGDLMADQAISSDKIVAFERSLGQPNQANTSVSVVPVTMQVASAAAPGASVTTVTLSEPSATPIEARVIPVSVVGGDASAQGVGGGIEIASNGSASTLTVKSTETSAALMPATEVALGENLTSFTVVSASGESADFKGTIVDGKLVIVAPGGEAKQMIQFQKQSVIGAALAALQPSTTLIAEISGIVLDMR